MALTMKHVLFHSLVTVPFKTMGCCATICWLGDHHARGRGQGQADVVNCKSNYFVTNDIWPKTHNRCGWGEAYILWQLSHDIIHPVFAEITGLIPGPSCIYALLIA